MKNIIIVITIQMQSQSIQELEESHVQLDKKDIDIKALQNCFGIVNNKTSPRLALDESGAVLL